MQSDCRSKMWRVIALAGAVGLAAAVATAEPDKKSAPKAVRSTVTQPAAKSRPVVVSQPVSKKALDLPISPSAAAKHKDTEALKGPGRITGIPSGLRGPNPGGNSCATATNVGTLPASVLTNTAINGAPNQPVGTCTVSYGTNVSAVWYAVTGTGTRLEITTCSDDTFIDTKLHVWTGDCNSLTCVAGNDDDPTCAAGGFDPPTWRSRVNFCSNAGQTYYVMIHGYQFHADPNMYQGQVRLSVVDTGVACGGPVPDDCATAQTISGALPLSVAFDNSTATTSFDGQANSGCFFFGSTAIDHDLWYKWTAPSSGVAFLSTCNTTTVDTKLAAYAGGTCPPSGESIACNDDACGLQSQITWVVTAGQVYTIQVGTYPGAAGGTGTFSLNVLPQPTNDECGNAINLTGTLPIVFSADTIAATTGFDGQGNSSCNYFGDTTISHDIWFRWTATTSGVVRLSGCTGHTDDTKVAVYQGATCPPGVAIACNDDFCGVTSEAYFTASAGTTYLFQIGAYPTATGGTGTFTLEPATPACTITPPVGSTPEGEANRGGTCDASHVDFVNGGCNSIPPIFSSIACGQPVSGTIGADGEFRDTDWYAITINNPHDVTWTVNANFPALIGVVENNGIDDCAGATAFRVFQTSTGCGEILVTTSLSPGTWWFFVSSANFGGVPCVPGFGEYVATLQFANTCADQPTGACCAGSGCSITTQAGCTGTWLGANTSCTSAGTPTNFTNNVTLPIPDGACPTGVSDTINVGASFTVADVNVRVQIPDHTWLADLQVALVHGSTTVILWDDQCGSNDGLDVTFDDSGAPVLCGTPTMGTYRPLQALSAFNGANSSGAWTLQVCDDAGADFGTLVSWTLSVSAPGPSPCSAACPVDMDNNGAVEPADVAGFISIWFTSLQNGTLAGDFDHNNAVEPSDVAAFVSAWFSALQAGHCP